MSSLTFYTNPMSRGQIVRWALEEVAADYTQVIIEYGEQMKSPDFLAINPMGKVPAIKQGELVVTECAAICAYLADRYPEAQLSAPNDEQKANYYRWLFFAAGPLESAVTNNNLNFHTDSEQQRTAGYGSFAQTIAVVDDLLKKQDYVCGDTFSMADVYLGSHIIWGTEFKTLPSRDSFRAYQQRLIERPAYRSAKAIDQALIAESLS